MNLAVNISGDVTPRVAMLMKMLSGARRVEMVRAAGVEVQEVTREHVAALRRKAGSLADAKGAPTTGFYQAAAQEVGGPAALSASSDKAVLTITAKGFIRAFRDVEVKPRSAKYLAIPIAREAFGRRAAR